MVNYKKNNPLMNFDLSSEKVVNMSVESSKTQISLAIAYGRISSDKQKIEGSGIQGQLQSCKDRCKNNGNIKIEKFFQDEAISGTVLDRKGLMEAIKFLEKENKQYTRITHFLCSEVSRIARPEEVSEGLALLSRIESTGAKIITTLEHRDTSTDEGKLMDDIKLSIARYERKKIMKRAKNGMVSVALNGGRPFGFVPVGYKKVGVGKNAVIEIDDLRSNIISRGLEMFANNILISKVDLLNFFKGEGLTTSEKFFKGKLWISFIEKTFSLHRLFFYAGYIVYPNRGINEPIQGKWQGIISLDVVYKIINKLQNDGILKMTPRKTDLSQEFPMRGFLTCPSCGRMITSRYSKSSTGKKHPYYGCANKYCSHRENIPKEFLESEFEKFLESCKVPQQYINLIDLVVKKEWNNVKDLEELQKDKIKKDKLRIENRLKDIETLLMKTKIVDLYEKLEQERAELNAQKNVIEENLKNDFFVEEELLDLSNKIKGMVVNPMAFWKLGNAEVRQLLIGVRFGGELKFSKKSGYRTGDSGLLKLFSKIFGDINTVHYPERDSNPHSREATRFGV